MRSKLGFDELSVFLDQIFSIYQIISFSLTYPFSFILTNILSEKFSQGILFNLKIITDSNFNLLVIQPKITVKVLLLYSVILILIVLKSHFQGIVDPNYYPNR